MINLHRVCLISVVALLTACGGSDSKSSKPPSSASASSAATSSLNSSAAISSAVASSLANSSVASSSSANSSSVVMEAVKINGSVMINGAGSAAQIRPDALAIEVNVLANDRSNLNTVNPVASTYNNTGTFRFNADVTAPSDGSITINVSYPGVTSFSRNLSVGETINIEAILQEVPVQTVGIEETTSISGVAVEGFTVNVSAEDDGLQRDSMQIQIPRSLLPDDTTTLDVAVRTFDPNEPEDALLFPGAYADSDGNNLVSVAFNFAEINTASGEPVVQAMRKARQQKIAKAGGLHKVADDEPVIINRQIPLQSCRLLESLGDSDSLTPGFQVPVYTYNPNIGVWDLIGHGTIYNESGVMSSETQKIFDCENENYYLEILVTNEIFLRDWWNLDYPLTFTQPVNFCARIQLKNSDGESLAGITGAVIDDNGDMDFTTGYFTTDAQGYADITVSQAGNETSASLYFYNQDNYGYVRKTITLSNNCAAPVPQVVEIERPSLCSVSGKLAFKTGAPLERELVYGYSAEASSLFGFDFVSTDKNGVYRLNLPCKSGLEIMPLSAFWNSDQTNGIKLQTRIDGQLQSDEQSDDGKAVTMNPIVTDFVEPLVYAYYNVNTMRLTVQFYGAYSAFPISFSGTIANTKDEVIGNISGTASAVSLGGENDELGWYNLAQAELDYDLPVVPEDGFLRLKLTATDALNNSWPDLEAAIWAVQDEDAPQ